MRSLDPRANKGNRAEVNRNDTSPSILSIKSEADFAALFIARRYRLAAPVARVVAVDIPTKVVNNDGRIPVRRSGVGRLQDSLGGHCCDDFPEETFRTHFGAWTEDQPELRKLAKDFADLHARESLA